MLLYARREPGRWGARASGTGPDGLQLVVYASGHDRADVAREAVIAWFARAEGGR